MGPQLRRAATALFCALVVAGAAGCGGGPSKVKVTGKLLKNGQPLTVDRGTVVTVTFAPAIENPPQTYQARYSRETGGYVMELPPDTYRMSYIIVEKNQAPVTSPPELKSKTFELTKNQELDIEIK